MRNKTLSLLMAGLMVLQAGVPVMAAHTTDEVTELETTNSALSRQAATEGMVLFENNGALPMADAGKIALFGQGVYNTVKGGTGSGDVNQRDVVTVWEAFEGAGYEITTADYLANAQADYEEKQAAFDAEEHETRWATYKHRDLEITDDELAAAAEADTALYVISRNSGEGDDRVILTEDGEFNRGDYYLADEEEANLKKIAAAFENVIVCLNVGGVVDTTFFGAINEEIPDGLDALLLMSQGGQEIGNALVDVLTGKVNPSGKTVDTWAKSYSDYPASAIIGAADGDAINEAYPEGIYVGYRYFDTFGKEVSYPFGYGISYTTFDIEVLGVDADAATTDVSVKVTNSGEYAGKEVVEVYFSAPDGSLEKPYQELAAFAKTNELAPGESQELTVTFLTAEMGSYSEEKSAYIMEAGDYIIRVGNSSRDTQVAAVLTLAEEALIEQLAPTFREGNEDLEELSKEGATPYTYDGEADEIAAAAVIELDAAALADGPEASSEEDLARIDAVQAAKATVTTYLTEAQAADYTAVENETVEIVDAVEDATLYQVYAGEITMEQFLASLTTQQLADIVNGNRGVDTTTTFVGAQANSVDGAAGESTPLYFEKEGIPNIVMADGPAGIRITQNYEKDGEQFYQFCTAWPIGTMMAQTWNLDLETQIGAAIGAEMVEYGVTLWLAPGMNIHRDPLCGRNFEYYSEDPIMTGAMGAAVTTGIQSNPGIGVTIKHYATNNQEINRNTENNTISERALREIYLKGFEMVVRQAQPMAVMSSYNFINGIYADSNYDLLENMLRGEWDFRGMVMTDWGAGNRSSISASLHAGNDLTMPGGVQERIVNALDPSIEGTENEFETQVGLKDGTVILGDLQKCASRVLNLLMNSSQFAKMNAEQGVEAVPYEPDADMLFYISVQ